MLGEINMEKIFLVIILAIGIAILFYCSFAKRKIIVPFISIENIQKFKNGDISFEQKWNNILIFAIDPSGDRHTYILNYENMKI